MRFVQNSILMRGTGTQVSIASVTAEEATYKKWIIFFLFSVPSSRTANGVACRPLEHSVSNCITAKVFFAKIVSFPPSLSSGITEIMRLPDGGLVVAAHFISVKSHSRPYRPYCYLLEITMSSHLRCTHLKKTVLCGERVP